ncbi:MAG: HlyD family type I secretion periplasmic adaptor subunit [Hyphomicrobiales bacterium]|nr:HlyD family type I secretion periplasmic adaptor subunit [Hyphomicrobiales bacterium]
MIPSDGQELIPITSSRSPLLVGVFIFILLFCGIGGWAYFAKLSGAVVAHGIVVVTSKPKTIQHLDGGIVSKILVEDGSLVEEDELLISLDDRLLRINLELNSSKLREYTARKARLIAERDNQYTIVWDDHLLNMLEIDTNETIKLAQKNLFDARKKTRRGQVTQLEEKIIQLISRIKGASSQLNSIDAQIKFIELELKGLRSLKSKKMIPDSRLYEFEREKEKLLNQKAGVESSLDISENQINEISAQVAQIELEFRQSVLTDLGLIDLEINDVAQQIYAILEKLKRVHVRAPVSGLVHELRIFTIGGVISPGASIMQIIPHDDADEVEIKVEPQSIDELAPGQLSTLRFTAFNQKTTPELFGQIKTISANSIEDPQTGIPYFKVNIMIPPDQISRLKGQKLIPGMPVEAFIKTRERTVLNYLLKPLLDQIQHSFREE